MTSLAPTNTDATLRSSPIPRPAHPQLDRGYGSPSVTRPHYSATESTDFGYAAHERPTYSSPLSQSVQQNHGRLNDEWESGQRSPINEHHKMNRSNSGASQGEATLPSRGATLKKKPSLKRKSSLGRSGSRRSSRAGSVRSLALHPDADESNSAFFSPVPTTGNPTEILANRFAAWRKVLKDLITYFREIQTQYDHRSKNLLKISNVINGTATPNLFLPSGGIDDALQILRNYHKLSIAEANKSKMIEEDVILALTGLRSDLQQKIKEIKNLSGDFKNSVEKEMDATRKAVQLLGEALGQSEIDSAQITGKQDPYLLKLHVDRQVEKQIDEENYLHQAYLNLEASGRELEAIVVGEIQKSYNAYAGIIKREADEAYNAVDSLRTGPIAMPKDLEWDSFIEKDDHFIDPKVPVRSAENIHYPGRDHENASEVRAGLLERKSKYLKSYTAGWYVLSPTHLHEFKSADKSQAPIMSLYLPEQKLGSHSTEGGSSNKFMLKGRQTGALHRGHAWVFRAESHDTMMAWYEDIKTLTEKSPQERSEFVRQHARSVSGNSQKPSSVSSDGAMDEEDEEPFSVATSEVVSQPLKQDVMPKRPQPGGRFPSELLVNANRGLQVPLSPSSGSSGLGDTQDHDAIAAAAVLPGSGVGQHYPQYNRDSYYYGLDSTGEMVPSHASRLNDYAMEDGVNPYTYEPVQKHDMLGSSPVRATSAAFGGATTEPYHDRQAETAPEVAPIQHPTDFTTEPNRDEVSHLESIPMVNPMVLNNAERSHFDGLPMAESSTLATPYGKLVGDSISKNERDLIPVAPINILGPAPQEIKNDLEVTESVPKPVIVAPVAQIETAATSTGLSDALRAGQHNERVQSISRLHVPGEFPISPPTEEDAS